MRFCAGQGTDDRTRALNRRARGIPCESINNQYINMLHAWLINKQISVYNHAVRRKSGTLVPLELAICVCAFELRDEGVEAFHGYEVAKRLGDVGNHKLLTAYGTLYRALGRLEAMGFLQSRWEDPMIAANEGRPRRRLYSLTASGEEAVQEARKSAREKSVEPLRGRTAPT
jgi:DNA-binding PadR family transcriptional regulator